MWRNVSLVVGVNLAILFVFNVAASLIGFGIPVTQAVFPFEKCYYLALQFGVMLALGLALPFPLIFLWIPVSHALIFFESQPLGTAAVELLSGKLGVAAYLVAPAAVFPVCIDGLVVQIIGLIIGMYFGRWIT